MIGYRGGSPNPDPRAFRRAIRGKDLANEGEILTQIQAATEALDELDNVLRRPPPSMGYRIYPRLSEQLSFATRGISQAQARPTDGQLQVMMEVEAEIQRRRVELQAIIDGPIAALNRLLQGQARILVGGGRLDHADPTALDTGPFVRIVLPESSGSSWARRPQAQEPGYEFRYHTYAESTALLQELAEAYPGLAKLYSIGKSATGTKEIWCIEIGNQATGAPRPNPPRISTATSTPRR